MTENNVPVTRVLKLRYSCESDFIVESKSLKLYLNSFNMSNFGANTKECLEICQKLIEKDLSEKLCTDVEVNFISENVYYIEIFKDYNDIMDFVNESCLNISEFKEAPYLLKISNMYEKKCEQKLRFSSLRSNCRVTHQPDFGDVYIYYKSKKVIDCSSLVQYLVSFRSEYHFHEECCEMIYKRLYDLLEEGDSLMVCALYTRRGGIDITPVRMSEDLDFADINELLNLNTFARSGIKQ